MSKDSSNAPVVNNGQEQQVQSGVGATGFIGPDSKPNKLPWGPVVAVVYAVFLYIAAQVAAVLALSLGVHLLSWDSVHVKVWLANDTVAQFLYMLVAEALTIAGIVWFVRRRGARMGQIGWNKLRGRYVWTALVGFGVYFLAYIAVTFAVTMLMPSIDINQQQNVGFKDVTTSTDLVLTFISLVILPPLAEELVFRGFVFGALRSRMVFWPATIITSVLFAIPHLQFGEGAPLLWFAAIDTLVLSLVLCYVRERTGSLWPAILIHALKNGLAFTALFLIH